MEEESEGIKRLKRNEADLILIDSNSLDKDRLDPLSLLKEQFPQLTIAINGGVKTFDQAEQHLQYVDGVMIGREAYANPYMLVEADSRFFDDHYETPLREQVIVAMDEYAQKQVSFGAREWHIARHMLGLFQGQPGGRVWRRYLSQNGTGKNPQQHLLLRAYEAVQEATKHIYA